MTTDRTRYWILAGETLRRVTEFNLRALEAKEVITRWVISQGASGMFFNEGIVHCFFLTFNKKAPEPLGDWRRIYHKECQDDRLYAPTMRTEGGRKLARKMKELSDAFPSLIDLAKAIAFGPIIDARGEWIELSLLFVRGHLAIKTCTDWIPPYARARDFRPVA